MSFQAISSAQNLHTARYMAGQHFHNGHGIKNIRSSKLFGPEKNRKKLAPPSCKVPAY